MSKTTKKFAPEVRERAVRMVLDHERDPPSRWAAIVSIADKMKALEREVRELRQANEILHNASAYFAQVELDPLCLPSNNA